MAAADYLEKRAASQKPISASTPQSAPKQQDVPPPASAPAPAQSASGAPGFSWSGSGWLPSSQTVHNVINRAENKMLGGWADQITAGWPGSTANLANLRAQRAAEEAQMSPTAKATADIAAQFAPQNILMNRLPYAGPAVQGGVNALSNSVAQGNDAGQVAKDTAFGTATGGASMLVDPRVVKAAFKYGPVAGAVGGVGHAIMPHGELAALASPFVGNARLDQLTDWMGDKAASLVSNPDVRTALQNLIIGGGQTARDTPSGKQAMQNAQGALPSMGWDTAGTALQNLRGMLPF
jgi:hypothetical protein